MRIISGKHKGRKLAYPKDKFFRPTQDRVKESLFSILSESLQDARVLDLFCGTGGLGFEALSRGATSVVLVDSDIRYVKENMDHLDCKEQSRIFKSKVSSFLDRCTMVFDLIIMDPPWYELDQKTGRYILQNADLYELALSAILTRDLLSKGGIVVFEHHKKVSLDFLEKTVNFRQYTYGHTALTVVEY